MKYYTVSNYTHKKQITRLRVYNKIQSTQTGHTCLETSTHINTNVHTTVKNLQQEWRATRGSTIK